MKAGLGRLRKQISRKSEVPKARRSIVLEGQK
jgi:hypothetical protein